MAITVTPETFSFVSFDSAYIARIATLVAEQLGLTDINIEIAVDETSPLTRIDVEVTDSLISIRPLQQSELATTLAMARSMLRARDRLRGGFENAPLDTELSLPQAAAWDTYILGRITRMDIEVKKQAALYNFRNRHGFNDASDHVFEKIWNADSFTWDELSALSANTLTLSA
jgi:hypothetical protein